MKSALHIARNKASGKLRIVDDIFVAASERVEFPSIDIPDFVGDRDYKMLRAEDIDGIALRLRNYWCLGEDPIDDLMVVIENAGVGVVEDFVDSAKLDGVSQWFDDRPIMLLAKDKDGGVRRRFDAAHELGHLVLHRRLSMQDLEENLPLIEEQAMIFAGAFLLPGSAFISNIHDITLDTLADAKPRWKVSIGAMIKRAANLNLITSDHERNLWKYYSYRGWRGNEPYDDRIEVERPTNIRAAIEMIAEDGAAETRSLVEDIGVSVEDIARLSGCDIGVFIRGQSRPKLQLVNKDAEPAPAAND
ncbi:ImmA/IrrE family metallo-endopeptidase [Sphingomonas sp. AOB5]|uniref:ImmA/IrrE family metallo-endopeptidase n=1 Tax=Sphingomonas sp. AOB5 TaxID=3034017 RepID=UPI0023F7E09E|nr:ImmA/IrrE family metallo-endopeptidase [Sphingomonas sp. AOB5]MDF7777421.1 ImmA/IrrE family metallo-endopeptidase [Sphingomonas sp. AOB5]